MAIAFKFHTIHASFRDTGGTVIEQHYTIIWQCVHSESSYCVFTIIISTPHIQHSLCAQQSPHKEAAVVMETLWRLEPEASAKAVPSLGDYRCASSFLWMDISNTLHTPLTRSICYE